MIKLKDPHVDCQLTRREFLATAAAIGATLAWANADGQSPSASRAERREYFPQGVASGDPTYDSIVLWTRRPPVAGHPTEHLTVEISDRPDFAAIVASAIAPLLSENDWTVRILAAGLKPSTGYWYRFVDEFGFSSRIGRTRTAPATDDDRLIRFAFACCQNLNTGACNAYRRMILEDEKKAPSEQLEFVMHLGDFYYEVVWYPEDRPQGMYARHLRDVVRYPNGEKHADFHVPIDLDDYRAAYRGYLADPDLQDARARWPFVCMWDNHEFSWKGWQSFEDYGDGVFPAQTRKVAAAQAWFEYQPARIVRDGRLSLDRLPAPDVENVQVTRFDDHGLGLEPNNLAAINTLHLFRSLRWGKNVELFLTDSRSFRSRSIYLDAEFQALRNRAFPVLLPERAVEVLDAGRAYNGGDAPDTLGVGVPEIKNWRKDSPPQSMLGEAQKERFLSNLKDSTAVWKLWGNSVAMLDARIDVQNLPADLKAGWSGPGYATITPDDWSAYRTERNAILDYVRTEKITGFTSLAGDRHAFFAGVLSPSLPPREFEPVGVEFVTGSISAPGLAEAVEYSIPDDHPLKALYVSEPDPGAAPLASINLTTMHGVRSSLAFAQSGDLAKAMAVSNPDVGPHLSFVDWGGHGYVIMAASPTELESEIVCIPRPIERSPAADGGPLSYRIGYRVALWHADERPTLERVFVEGHPPFVSGNPR